MTLHPVNEHTRLPGAIAPEGIPVEAFNPLLRSLLSWDLVQRVETEDGTRQWVLKEDAQRRLDALAPRPRHSSASLAYLDHWCARCRQQRLTHLIEGRYLCQECQRAEAAGDQPVRPEPQSAHHAHELRPRRKAPRG
ncbi:MAG: hypothetical protein ACYDGN_05870 [Acidimicrobiales bacterium]